MSEVVSRQTPLLERGDIFFLYRPRVGLDEAHGLEDVERLYILLSPWRTQKYRLLIVGRKKLPDPGQHNRFWAFVYRVFRDGESLNEELGDEVYTARTHGVRQVAPMRSAGEGIYAIARHDHHTHLAYLLELPKNEGPAQRELNIEREASYGVAVKNPDSGGPPGAGLDRHHEARFPQKLQEQFAGRRFIAIDPPDFIDYEGAELMLIGASEDAERELGIEFKADAEDEQRADVFVRRYGSKYARGTVSPQQYPQGPSDVASSSIQKISGRSVNSEFMLLRSPESI
jgi:hypothetical protein